MASKTGNRCFILRRDTFVFYFGVDSLQKDGFELSETKQHKLEMGSSEDD